jgi:hypothetical protein
MGMAMISIEFAELAERNMIIYVAAMQSQRKEDHGGRQTDRNGTS